MTNLFLREPKSFIPERKAPLFLGELPAGLRGG